MGTCAFCALQPSAMERYVIARPVHLRLPMPCILSQRGGCARAMRGSSDSDDSSGLGQLEIEVPKEQRPVNELQQLKDSPLYSWVGYIRSPKVYFCVHWLITLFLSATPASFHVFHPF
jgi:hypothetical protein